jgi:hypothetical protein
MDCGSQAERLSPLFYGRYGHAVGRMYQQPKTSRRNDKQGVEYHDENHLAAECNFVLISDGQMKIRRHEFANKTKQLS